MVRRREGKSQATVAAIHTDYVRFRQQKIDRKRARKIRLYRRLTVFVIIAIVILGVMTHTFINQKQMLMKKEQEREALLANLVEVEEEQEALIRQLAKLDDDEYIAKLARQEYFLSEENEIIFSMPNKKEKDKKKTDEKE